MVFLPLAGLALGAAGMYLLDPQQGRRRRAQMRDKVGSQSRHLRDALAVGARDLRNRSRGAARQLWSSMDQGEVPDRVLVERVRAKIGRYLSHPSRVQVSVHGGRVALDGSVPSGECDDLLRVVRRVRGVRDVQDRLQRSGEQGGAAHARGAGRLNFLQPDWTPATRMVSGTAGTLLVLMGMRRRGLLGMAAGLAGAAMLARAATNRSLAELGVTATGDEHAERIEPQART